MEKKVPCIKCGEVGSVSVDVNDGFSIQCADCEATYTMDDVCAAMLAWSLVREWCKLHPSRIPPGHVARCVEVVPE